MLKFTHCFLAICFFVQLAATSAHAATEMSEALLTPPNANAPTKVLASFQLQNINSIDDVQESFHFSGILTLQWQDGRQAFDPKEAGVKEKIYQGSFQNNEVSPAWFPQVVLANELGSVEKDGSLLRVQPDGNCILMETISASAKTMINMRRYPFDHQSLEAEFEVFGFDNTEVVLEAAQNASVLPNQKLRVSQWTIDKVSTTSGTHAASHYGKLGVSSTLVLRIDASRQSFFMFRLIIFPMMVIVILSWSVFWMDRSSLGDRINVSFIGILTAVAYQIVVGEILPHISYITWINGFLNVSMLIMCASVAENLVVGACDKKGLMDLGDRIDLRCRWQFPLAYIALLGVMTLVSFTVY